MKSSKKMQNDEREKNEKKVLYYNWSSSYYLHYNWYSVFLYYK